MGDAHPKHDGRVDAFLPSLVSAVRKVNDEGAEITTASFTALMDQVVRVFDHLGTVLHFAKHDMVVKNDSLKAVAHRLKYLQQVVEEDRRAGKATVKDSRARNLHRLLCVVTFMRVLLENFSKGPNVTTYDAASAAYQHALAPIHTYVVRTAVWAGMYVLPSREGFMHQIGETETTAKQHANEFMEYSKDVERQILRLFAGIDMPASAPSSNILAGLGLGWGWGSGSSNSNNNDSSNHGSSA